MAERDLLLIALVKEVLGPRGGHAETLRTDEDPLDEYIVGVLAPHQHASVELDADEELVGDEEPLADDQLDTGNVVQPAFDLTNLPAPALDPRSRPASLGLSFCLIGTPPRIDLCATWARYEPTAGGSWQRRAHGHVWNGLDCSHDNQLQPPTDEGVRVHVRTRIEAQRWRVSIFLVNVTRCDDRPRTHHLATARHLATCRQNLVRIRAGIDLVVNDGDARLAFCFANRAIALQARWTKGRIYPWWAFQLAFQLLNLPALVDRHHADRGICDLLWFPTGGGKTEAYLGLAAFTMAIRRLQAIRMGSPRLRRWSRDPVALHAPSAHHSAVETRPRAHHCS